MRRRQIFAMQSKALNHEGAIHEEAKRQAPAEEVLSEVISHGVIQHVKASACPTCGKIIGRGMAMHQKHCKGL